MQTINIGSGMAIKAKSCLFWAGMDEWQLIQVSVLFNNIDPEVLPKNITDLLVDAFEADQLINSSDIQGFLNETEIKKVHKTYQIFRRIEFGVKYADSPYYSWGASMYRHAYHPYLLMYEAIERDLPIPKNLMQAMNNRYFRATQTNFTPSKVKKSKLKEPAKKIRTGRSEEYDNIGKGIMAILLAKFSHRYTHGDDVSAKQIKESVLEMAKKMGIESFGLASLERDISAGLNQLKTTYNIDLKSAILLEK